MSKTVFITGANGGVGTALCKCFKDEGWSVIGNDISGKGNSYCDFFFNEDISSPHLIKDIRNTLRGKSISFQCLINNAAVQIEKKLVDTSIEEWNTIINTNLGSVFLTAKYFREFLSKGSIINVSSVHARATSKGLASYVASKGAISALTRVMALEFAEYGIRVNSILPGAIDTDMLKKGLGRNRDPEKALNTLINATPLKKLGSPFDVAYLALFLADEIKASNITGQEFVCDGGVLAGLSSE